MVKSLLLMLLQQLFQLCFVNPQILVMNRAVFILPAFVQTEFPDTVHGIVVVGQGQVAALGIKWITFTHNLQGAGCILGKHAEIVISIKILNDFFARSFHQLCRQPGRRVGGVRIAQDFAAQQVVVADDQLFRVEVAAGVIEV